MIFSKTISGYQVYLKENKAIYENIFNDYLNDCLKIIQVFKNTKEFWSILKENVFPILF